MLDVLDVLDMTHPCVCEHVEFAGRTGGSGDRSGEFPKKRTGSHSVTAAGPPRHDRSRSAPRPPLRLRLTGGRGAEDTTSFLAGFNIQGHGGHGERIEESWIRTQTQKLAQGLGGAEKKVEVERMSPKWVETG